MMIGVTYPSHMNEVDIKNFENMGNGVCSLLDLAEQYYELEPLPNKDGIFRDLAKEVSNHARLMKVASEK